jgi:hypothetical protein
MQHNAVSYTPPHILMDSISSPDTSDRLHGVHQDVVETNFFFTGLQAPCSLNNNQPPYQHTIVLKQNSLQYELQVI